MIVVAGNVVDALGGFVCPGRFGVVDFGVINLGVLGGGYYAEFDAFFHADNI